MAHRSRCRHRIRDVPVISDTRQIATYQLRSQPTVMYHRLPGSSTTYVDNEDLRITENHFEEKRIKIVCISDTHNDHTNPIFSDRIKRMQGDILIHAGDFSDHGNTEEVNSAFHWLCSLDNFTYKIFISGNMDGIGLNDRYSKNPTGRNHHLFKNNHNVIYLENESVTIMGLNIYGCPYTPKFVGGFQYNRQSIEAEQLWDRIPENCDILISHGPPIGLLDQNSKGDYVGCKDLREAIFRRKSLKVVIFGHVHHSYGATSENKKWFINAAQYNGIYHNDSRNAPIELFIRSSDRSVCGLMGI